MKRNPYETTSASYSQAQIAAFTSSITVQDTIFTAMTLSLSQTHQMKTIHNMYLDGKSFIKLSSRTCFECSLFASVSNKV